ncbi:unnamed protein product [Penicillium bialowiezense]
MSLADESLARDPDSKTGLLGTTRAILLAITMVISYGTMETLAESRVLGWSYHRWAILLTETAQIPRKDRSQRLLRSQQVSYIPPRAKHRANSALWTHIASQASTGPNPGVQRPQFAHLLLLPTLDDDAVGLGGYRRATEEHTKKAWSDWEATRRLQKSTVQLTGTEDEMA